jgi:iron complex transport system substrate-binding protein
MKRLAVTFAVTLSLVLGACGDDTPSTSDAAVPRRIVSLSPTATEMLFAIGAGDQVVAVDDQSNYPKRAPKTDLSAYEPNVEAITAYNPDLVVISGDTKNLTSELGKVSIPVLDSPAAKTLEDTYKELNELGARTGHTSEAKAVVKRMREKIAALTKTAPKRSVPLTYYHELDNTLFTVTSKTFIGELYARAGLTNVADATDPDGKSGGYPQLSAEYLVTADPDLVFLADTKCCAQTAETFAARPGFATLKAVARNGVVNLDDDIASRWGPRVVDFLARIVAAVKAIPQA